MEKDEAISKDGTLLPEEALIKDPTAVEDFTPLVQEFLKKCEERKTKEELEEIIVEFHELEKKCRIGYDCNSVIKLCSYMLRRTFNPSESIETYRKQELTKREEFKKSLDPKNISFFSKNTKNPKTCITELTNSTQYLVSYIPNEPEMTKVPIQVYNERNIYNTFQLLRKYIMLKGQMKRVICELIRLVFYFIYFDEKINKTQTISKELAELVHGTDDILENDIIRTNLDNGNSYIASMRCLLSFVQGKMFMEVEKARMVMLITLALENKGYLDSAAILVQEIHVESIGAMEKHEKTAYILEQMRIVLLREDYPRLQILSKKMSEKVLEKDDMQEMKVKYNIFMTYYFINQKKPLLVSEAMEKICNTQLIIESAYRVVSLQMLTIFTLQCEDSQERNNILNNIMKTINGNNLHMIDYKFLLEGFFSTELIAWPLKDEKSISQHFLFNNTHYDNGQEKFDTLRRRALQHNICTIGKFYSRAHIKRVAELCNIKPEETEELCCELVNNKTIHAKIDRPAGIISFQKGSKSIQALDAFVRNFNDILTIADETSHLIHKERTGLIAFTKRILNDAKNA